MAPETRMTPGAAGSGWRRGMIGLWVSPLRRSSSEGLPAALTRPRWLLCTTLFLMYVRDSVRCLAVDTLRALDPGQMSVVMGDQP